ncbi:EAL domain-containing protein [Caldichromatium japonicum]|uniref:EAL domain-containing protein n=2 Tax=Caldichromatium japonicum TaxID=2699430 RepID=A0A6G7VH26_9GAMM|nr:EAL domain-containing protein [Caldichromatium japonicum]
MRDLKEFIDIHIPQDLDKLSEEELERLPYGAIRVDREGRILFYSRYQLEFANRQVEQVLGRNFFSEVAPCTVVPEFYGRFKRGVLTGHLQTTFDFVFDFDMQPVQVRIHMRDSERPDEYWILIQPLQFLPPRNEGAARELILGKFCEGMVKAISFDFSQCDREPISTCGAIQSFGCLLVVDPATHTILACSANTEMYLERAPEELLDRPLSELFAESEAPELHAALATDASSMLYPSFFLLKGPTGGLSLSVRLHFWRGRWLLEIEHYDEMEIDFIIQRFDLSAFQQRLRTSADIKQVCQIAVESFRKLTGFDRVIIYRFDGDWSGVVIAESVEPELWPSILGLRYPATDIPCQARALYRETPMRYAPSRDHSDIPLLSRSLAPDQIDIGIAHLRAHSPIHRNYLQRFKVNGSMSLSIVCDEQLWGLVIFHHRAPHPITAYARQRLIELGGYLSERIALLEEREHNLANQLGIARVNAIIGNVDIKLPFPENFIGKEQQLCELVDADMVQIFHRQQAVFISQGLPLSPEETRAFLAFLQTRPDPLWDTDCLSGDFEPAAAYPERLAGVLAIFIDEQREDILVFGRRRVRYTVNWGADPASLPFADEDSVRPLGWPIREFRVWCEERTHHSLPWSLVALATAHALKGLIQKVIVANAAHYERLALSLAQQRDQLQRSREEMRYRALHDALTGLPNRAHFREALVDLLEQSRHTGRSFGVALMDIDHFKMINDTLGHDKGDLLLCAAARRISKTLPQSAMVARLGGDEFALLFPDADTAFSQVEQIVEAMRQPFLVGDDTFSVTSSLGLAIGDPDSDPSELLKKADLALYRAKEAGRNRVAYFNSELEAQALKRLEIDRAVLRRSPLDAIEILLQPQLPICAKTHLPRFEVLARWRSEDGTLIMPGDFIPAAERNGLIQAVTKAVFRIAIRLLSQRFNQGGGEVRLAINVSAADLESTDFVFQLLKDLHAADIPPELIEIEITESMLLRMTVGVKSALRALNHAGILLSLDDFGTGFSSMAYLRELPIDSLKIDRDFVRGIETVHDRNLIAGMIAMAHSLGKEVIAEGVETPRQLEQLAALGCDWGQGYFWSSPIPPDQTFAEFG